MNIKSYSFIIKSKVSYCECTYINLCIQVDDTGTVAKEDRLKAEQTNSEAAETSTSESVPEDTSAVPINENLFVDDDLEGLDDELNDLDLDQ